MQKLGLTLAFLVMFARVMHADIAAFMLNDVENPASISFFDALHRALERNDELKKAEADVRIAEGESLGTMSKLMPKLNSKLTYETPPRNPNDPFDGQSSLGLNAHVPLFDGKSLFETRAKRENFQAAKTRARATRDTLIYDVATLYIDAAIAQALMQNAQEEREVYQNQAAILERKSKVGNARNLDIRRAHYLAAKSHSEYLLKRHEFLKRLGALGKKIGVYEVFLLSNVNVDSPHVKKDAQTLRELAKSSPDILALEKEVSSASYAVISEGFDFVPKFFATFDGGWQKAMSSHRVLDEKAGLMVKSILTVELPIFSGGATYAALKVNHARKTNAEINLRMKLVEKNLTINSALAELGDLDVVIASAQLALDAAQLAKESAQRMFDNNEATGLELVEANSNHLSAKNLLMNSLLGRERAKLQLLFTVGTIGEIVP